MKTRIVPRLLPVITFMTDMTFMKIFIIQTPEPASVTYCTSDQVQYHGQSNSSRLKLVSIFRKDFFCKSGLKDFVTFKRNCSFYLSYGFICNWLKEG